MGVSVSITLDFANYVGSDDIQNLMNILLIVKLPGASLGHFMEYALMRGSGGTPPCMGQEVKPCGRIWS